MQFFAVGRGLAVGVEDGECAPDAVVRRGSALDLSNRFGDRWYPPAKIQFDGYHHGLRDGHLDGLWEFTSAAVPEIKNNCGGRQHYNDCDGSEPSSDAPNWWSPGAGLTRVKILF